MLYFGDREALSLGRANLYEISGHMKHCEKNRGESMGGMTIAVLILKLWRAFDDLQSHALR
jgi:hypothetical protein